MKNKTVNLICTLFCVFSAALFIAPVFLESMAGDALSAYGFLAIFIIIILMVAHLLMGRKAISDRDIMHRLTILNWELPPSEGAGVTENLVKKRAALLVALLFAVAAAAIGAMLLSGSPATVAIPLCLAAFFGASAISIYNANASFNAFGGSNGFRLCHNALYLQGKCLKLDGLRCAISKVEADKTASLLKLKIVRNNCEFDMSIPIPPDQMQNTLDFISDLNAHFDKQNSNQNNQ